MDEEEDGQNGLESNDGLEPSHNFEGSQKLDQLATVTLYVDKMRAQFLVQARKEAGHDLVRGSRYK